MAKPMTRYDAFRLMRDAMRHLAAGDCGPSDAPETFLALATLETLCGKLVIETL